MFLKFEPILKIKKVFRKIYKHIYFVDLVKFIKCIEFIIVRQKNKTQLLGLAFCQTLDAHPRVVKAKQTTI